MADWEIIFSSRKPMEVSFAKNFLESEGIQTLLQNELASQLYGYQVDQVKLLVQKKDIEQAIEKLKKSGYIKTEP